MVSEQKTTDRRTLSPPEPEQNLVASIFDAALDPLFQVNEKGIIVMANIAATKQFGWTKEEFIGNDISMIVGMEHAHQHGQYIERYLETGEKRVMGTKRELPARRKDGSEFIVHLSLTEVVVAEGEERMFCGFVVDLTEQKLRVSNLEKEKNLVAGVIDAALDPLFQVNEKGLIVMVNNAATTQFGWTREEFIGNDITMIVGKEHSPEKHGQYMERYLRTGEARVIGKKRELSARRKDGSEFVIQLSLVEVRVAEGEERMFCGFIVDLTDQKRHSSEIQQREAFTNKIIEGSYDALLVTDKEGKINRVNAAAVRHFECSREELCTRSAFSFFDPFDAEWLKDEMDKFLATGVPVDVQKELEAVRPKSDTTFPASVSISDLGGPDGEPCFAVYLHDLTERKRMLRIEAEKNAAEYLLFNMLPAEIAGQLKDDPSHIAESHNFSAVLFADIVGFTSMTSTMDPRAVVSMLNDLFSMFDEVVEKYGLNKVKTIGDCYMVTSVPAIEVDDEVEHCRLMCHFSLDMIAALQKYNSKGPDRKLDLRVGINCGPVVAGVVGTKRFLYDLWGDAVNLASRMESTGIPGRIQTTSHVVQLMKDHFSFEKRGMVHVKGKGEMETYFLIDRKKQYKPTPLSPGRRMSRMSIWSPADHPSRLNFSRDTDLMTSFRNLATDLEIARSNETERNRLS
jgi:PAS domain S-box-containing protein